MSAHQQKAGRIGERAGQRVRCGFRGGDDRLCAMAAGEPHEAAEVGAGKWFLEFQAVAHAAPVAMDCREVVVKSSRPHASVKQPTGNRVNTCHCERSEALPIEIRTAMEIAASLRS